MTPFLIKISLTRHPDQGRDPAPSITNNTNAEYAYQWAKFGCIFASK
jgi:hypothetical protein